MVPSAEKNNPHMVAGARFQSESLIQEQGLSFSGFEYNRFFQNTGNSKFYEVSGAIGADIVLDGRGVASGDLDNDGDIDLVIANRNAPHITMLRNDHLTSNHFLAVDVQGSHSNRMGIGTQMTLTCDKKKQTRTVALGQGFMSQSSTTISFGLGLCRKVETLEVRWPLGLRQTFKGIAADQKILITEGQSEWKALPLKPRNHTLTQPVIAQKEMSPLELIPSPDWTLPGLDGQSFSMQQYQNQTVLINFWATWCIPCRKEIEELIHVYPQFKQNQIEIIGISVDELPLDKVKHFAARSHVSYPMVHDQTGTVYRDYQQALQKKQTEIPLSLLIHHGKIVQAFYGVMTPELLSKIPGQIPK